MMLALPDLPRRGGRFRAMRACSTGRA
jgi:hypothetical protein